MIRLQWKTIACSVAKTVGGAKGGSTALACVISPSFAVDEGKVSFVPSHVVKKNETYTGSTILSRTKLWSIWLLYKPYFGVQFDISFIP